MSTSRAKMKLETSPHKVVMMLLEEADGSTMNPEKKKIEKLVQEAYKRMGANFYLALRLTRNATAQEVKKNYRTLSLLYHPDKSRADTSELFQCISRAYEVLSDETERAKYDRKIFGSRRASTDQNKENSAPKPASGPKKKSSSTSSTSSTAATSDRPSRPPAPFSLRCSVVDHESVTLFWKMRPYESKITFELQTKKIDEIGWPKPASGICNPACRKKNLDPQTAYHFRVRAVNSTGTASAWSISVTVATTREASSKSTVAGSSRSSGGGCRSSDSSGSGDSAYPSVNIPPKRQFNAKDGDNVFRSRQSERTSATSMPPPPPSSQNAYSTSSSKPAGTEPPPPAPPRASTCRPKPTDPPKEASAVPPLKLNWACNVCKRQNAIGFEKCRVCGTTRDYASERINNISEYPDIEAVRQRERERFASARSQRDAAEAAAKATFDACYKETYKPEESYPPSSCDPNNTNDPKSDSPVRSRPQTARTARPEDSETGIDEREAAKKARKARKRAEREAFRQKMEEKNKKNKKNKATGTTNPMSNQDVQGSPFETNEYTKSAGQSESQQPSSSSSTSNNAWKKAKRVIRRNVSFGMRRAAGMLRSTRD